MVSPHHGSTLPSLCCSEVPRGSHVYAHGAPQFWGTGNSVLGKLPSGFSSQNKKGCIVLWATLVPTSVLQDHPYVPTSFQKLINFLKIGVGFTCSGMTKIGMCVVCFLV